MGIGISGPTTTEDVETRCVPMSEGVLVAFEGAVCFEPVESLDEDENELEKSIRSV
jgi:hypothetical protein